jgi:Baseplate J-like protein
MACVILRPDPQVLFNQLRDMFSSTVLGGGSVIPESNEHYVVANDYALAESFYAVADQMWRENNPETACCDNLYLMAARNGVFPRPAAHAQGYARLYGTIGASVPLSFEIQTSLGIYVSVGSIPLTIPDAGNIIAQVRALVPGSAMNAAGTVLTGTLTTPAPGIETNVEICGGSFCGGKEAETCEQFRQRYLERLAYSPRATMDWIKAKLLEYPCATRVCIREGACCKCTPECGECGCKTCGNRMEFYVLFAGFPCGIPPTNIVEDINKWLFGEPQGYGLGQVEIGVCGQIYAPVPLMVDVIIDIVGCPSISQKQMIQDQIRALFDRICPSKPLTGKQLELIIANIIGAEISASVRFEIVAGQPPNLAFVDHCGIDAACDTLPCLNEIVFTGPDASNPPC